MEIIENCIRSSDSSGLHALKSIWDDGDPDTFSANSLLKSRRTLLMTSSKLGHLECCKFLLSIGSPSINTRNNDGFTALHYAAYHGYEAVVFLLLDAGADVKLLNNYNESALDSAVAAGHHSLVERLRGSRYLSPPKILPGLFDFSFAFLGDLQEKLKNLPSEKEIQNTTLIPIVSNRDSVDAVSNSSSGKSHDNNNYNDDNNNINNINKNNDNDYYDTKENKNNNLACKGNKIKEKKNSFHSSSNHDNDNKKENDNINNNNSNNKINSNNNNNDNKNENENINNNKKNNNNNNNNNKNNSNNDNNSNNNNKNNSNNDNNSNNNNKNNSNNIDISCSNKCIDIDFNTKPGDDNTLSEGEIFEININDNINKKNNQSNSTKNNGIVNKKLMNTEKLPISNNLMSSPKKPSAGMGISRYDALKYCIEFVSIMEGGDENLINILPCSYLLPQENNEGNKEKGKGKEEGKGKEKGKEKDLDETDRGGREISGPRSLSELEKMENISKKDINNDFTIGRSRGNDYNINDLSISKNHAIISYYNNVGFLLRDLGSKHGTFIDNKRIGVKNEIEKGKKILSGRTNNGILLVDGMILQFGRVICRIFKKKQSAVISKGFLPNKNLKIIQEESEDMIGKKRTALMALYGHYEKPGKSLKEPISDMTNRKNSGSSSGSKSEIKSSDVLKQNLNMQTEQFQLQPQVQVQVQLDYRQLSIDHNQKMHYEDKEFEYDKQMEVGKTLLLKMGWEGSAIGRSGAPAAKPLSAVMRSNREGLGIISEISHDIQYNDNNYDNNHTTVDSKKTILRNKMIDRYHTIK